MKNINNKLSSYKLILGMFTMSMVLNSCTNLEIEATDSVFQDPNDSSFQGVTDPDSFLSNAFNSINGLVGGQENLFALSEVTTDASVVPTRGSDWGDNGIWRQLHQHDWRPSHFYIENVWNQWNNVHLQAAQLLSERTTASANVKASASFLRALGVYIILDNFGQVPIRDVTAPPFDNPPVIQGQEAIDLIVSDLNDAIDGLEAEAPGAGNSRPNKAAARYLLAKVLLNKHVYLKTEPNAGDMQEVIDLVNSINAEGYDLVEGYFDIFERELDNETIWFLTQSVENRIWNGLHYNQAPEIVGGGWNGFATLAEYYNMFEGDSDVNTPGSGQEERRGFVPTEGLPLNEVVNSSDINNNGIADGSSVGYGFLINQQYADNGSPLKDRGGNPLTFKKNFVDGEGNSSLLNNGETTGIRLIKYNPRNGASRQHEIFFRYADAHLMKAEAAFRMGDVGTATTLINELRTIRKASPIANLTELDILDERGRELYAELWRRNDMIRFGQYTRNWELKAESQVGNEIRNLFPIPANQVILNPNLVQNPGY
ncbi:RagB/SusD family nutrient uptake outer membrane protein [Flavimarina sp. Hel_I_48]|uniref:RagB/SusD family nutrient uptake outer membrane protein n=1 Tax=Flavimarina sp. Hel_I_48 TaxID=1392488 RepID=UPI0004DFA534|nr:RagB/SusD family nutrient uptake outer membrane protein [Flavimarina sp. Hel_I_48]